MYKASGCICDGKMYILGGCDIVGDDGPKPVKFAYEVELSSLKQACTASPSTEISYSKIASLPLSISTVAVCQFSDIFWLLVALSITKTGSLLVKFMHITHQVVPGSNWLTHLYSKSAASVSLLLLTEGISCN